MTDPQPSILLVEDDPLLRDSFAILLEESGYQVFTAGTAADAIRITGEERPGIVVLDLGLPDRPGLDVVRAIREDTAVSATPVIALTGRVGAAEEQESLEAGCDLYLVKPIAPTRLLSELEALVET